MKVAFTGGKGGTGKSTIAVNVANVLSKFGKAVLIDADAGCPNDHIFFGAELRNGTPVELFVPIINDRCDLCEKCVDACPENALIKLNGKIKVFPNMCNGCGTCKIVCPRNAIDNGKKVVGYVYFSKLRGLNLLTASIVEGEKESLHAINKAKSLARGDYDFYIYDTSAGTGSSVVSVLEDADIIVAVTEPTPFGAHDLKLILDITSQLNKRTFVVINRSDIGDNSKIERLCNERGVKIISRIKFDRELVKYYISQKLLDENVDAYSEIKRIANFIRGESS